MRHAVSFLAALLAAASISACKGLQMCGPPGQTQACLCSGGRHGAQACLPERVWDKCDCTGATKLAHADAAVPMVGVGARMSPPPPSNSGSNMDAAAMKSPAPVNDSGASTPDARVAADASAPMLVSDAATSSNAPDAHVDAGSKSGGNAYKACSADSDCMPSGTCDKTTDPTSLNMVSACRPNCGADGDCPKPKGSYEASVTCDTTNHVCELDCAPTALLGPTLSCPSGESCVGNLVGAFLCYAN